MRRKHVALSIGLMVSAVALPAVAVEGRIPVFAPGPIVASGKYIVTRNLPAGVNPIITIAAAKVDLDLNGFEIGSGGAGFPAISISAPASDVAIRNGTLTGSIEMAAGVSASTVVIEDVRIQEFVGGWSIQLLNVGKAAIRRVAVESGFGRGILVDGWGASYKGVSIIEGCSLQTHVDSAIKVMDGQYAVRDNVISTDNTHGIVLENAAGSIVAGNIVRAGATGIFLNGGSGHKVFNNVVNQCFFHGIHVLSDGNMILDNLVTGCGFNSGEHGIFVQGNRNHIGRNTLNNNFGYGLAFAAGSTANIYGGNMARGNTGPVVACGPLFPPNSCDLGAGNTTYGDNLIPGPPVF